MAAQGDSMAAADFRRCRSRQRACGPCGWSLQLTSARWAYKLRSTDMAANVLILRGLIRIQPAVQAISYKDVHKLIHQFMQDDRVPSTAGREVMGQFNALNHILFAMTNPTTLDAGFGSTWDIEDTRHIGELGIMELCGVRVCHGRLPGPDDKGYHQLMEAAWVSRAESLVSQWREEARNPEMTNKQQEIGELLALPF